MACIGCQRIKTQDMENKIKSLKDKGFNTNQIAAMLMIQKSMVEETLAAPVVKKTTKKTIIEDEQL